MNQKPTFIVSATARDGAAELAHTRQEVTTEAEARRIVYARNKAERAVNGEHTWGFYPKGSPLDSNQ